MTVYETFLDKKTKLITLGITTLLFIVTLSQLGFFGAKPTSLALFIAVLLGIVYAICFALSPKNYATTENAFIINKRVGKVMVNRNEIVNVELLAKDALDRSLRTFGVGGLFGYFGKFYNKNYGKMIWYASSKTNAILITTNAKKIVVTPQEAEKLFKDLKK